jgi:adenylosuccinate synthase
MLNGVTQLFMMKVDVLSDLGDIMVCDSYAYQGKQTDEFTVEFDHSWSTNLKKFPSWNNHAFNKYDEFPVQLKDYITYIEERTKVPVNLVSIGPERDRTILK